MNRERLYSRWLRLMSNLGISQPMDIQFDELWNSYNDTPRKYHNIKHLYYVLNAYDTMVHLLDEPVLVELALWYHDIFMDFSGLLDNERESVSVFTHHFDRQLTWNQMNGVRVLIMATKISNEMYPSFDEECISDIDMMGFADAKVVRDNADLIRKEYKDTPEDVFDKNRVRFLKSLINNGVYRTSFVKSQFESIAMRHISCEIKTIFNKRSFNES